MIPVSTTASTGGADQTIANGNLGSYARLRNTAGNVGIGTPLPATKLDVIGTLRAVSAGAPIGSYLMPTGGGGNSYRTGLGVNLYWDGANWIAKGDGVNNGAAGILGSNGVAALTFFTIPSTGGADQVISNTNLANYARMSIDPAGKVSIGNLNQMVYLRPLARIIHVSEDTKSLLCYKHVAQTMFEAPEEAFA